jgi:hypothetical protein
MCDFRQSKQPAGVQNVQIGLQRIKMLIPITGDGCGTGNEPREWALVELQGRVEAHGVDEGQAIKEIGMLRLSKTVR